MTEPASIRYKNPGAMWGKGNPIATKWGAGPTVDLNDGLGQGNNIAVFPTYIAGICAQIDLWRTPRYKDKPFADAIKVWSGGNSVESYISFVTSRVPGMTRNTIMNDAFWTGPMCIPFLKAQAWHEAGKQYPAPDGDWIEAQHTVLSGTKVIITGTVPAKPIQPPSDIQLPKPKQPQTPVAPKVGAVGVLGAAMLATAHFIQSYPVPTACGVIAAVALAIYLVKRK